MIYRGSKSNPSLVTILILSNTLKISPAALFLPAAEAQRLQKSPAIQVDVIETHLTAYLNKTELLESHCQLVLHYAQAGEWKGAQKWLAEPTLWETMRESPDLNVLKKQAPEQWRALVEKMVIH